MSVILSGKVKTVDDDEGIPNNHPRIGMEDWFSADVSTLSASSEASGFEKENAVDGLDWDYWKPTGMPAWLKIDAGSSRDVTYFGIAGHNFRTNGVTVTPQYSTDNSTWQDASDPIVPDDDSPLMFIFDTTSARYWRLYLSGGTAPQVAVVQAGKALAFQRALWQGHTPINLARTTDVRPNRSEGGKWLGRSIIRRGNATSFEVDNLTDTWVRDKLDPFIEKARTRAFFLAWNPRDWPYEIGWVWTNDDIQPQQTGPRNLMSVGFDVVGVAYGGV